jgi:hypothetical protein
VYPILQECTSRKTSVSKCEKCFCHQVVQACTSS